MLLNNVLPTVSKEDVLSSWGGVRPLVRDPKKADTKSISRKHVIDISTTGLVTITGGKYTTYRVMAKEAVDAAIKGKVATLWKLYKKNN